MVYSGISWNSFERLFVVGVVGGGGFAVCVRFSSLIIFIFFPYNLSVIGRECIKVWEYLEGGGEGHKIYYISDME